MFARVSAFALVALPLLAVATPWGAPPPATTTVTVTAAAPTVTAASQCTTGDVQCCDSTQAANTLSSDLLLGLLGIVVGDITGLIGVTCSPITAIGLGSGSSCNSQTVCCSDNSFNGVVALGCTPVNINL